MRSSAAAALPALAVLLAGCAAFAPQPSPAPLGDPEGSAVPIVRSGAVGAPIPVGALAITVLDAGEWPSADQTLGPDLRGVSIRVRIANRGEAVLLPETTFQLVDERSGLRYTAASRTDAGDLALPLRLASGDTVEGIVSFTPPARERFTFRFVPDPETIGEAKLGRIVGRLAAGSGALAPELAGLPAPAPTGAPAGVCLRISGGLWDPAGPDGTASGLAKEYVKVRNTCAKTVSLRGWTLYDAGRRNVYAFASDQRLDAGKILRLYSGSGTETALALYWGRKAEVWGNAAPERAYLADPAGTVVSDWSPYP